MIFLYIGSLVPTSGGWRVRVRQNIQQSLFANNMLLSRKRDANVETALNVHWREGMLECLKSFCIFKVHWLAINLALVQLVLNGSYILLWDWNCNSRQLHLCSARNWRYFQFLGMCSWQQKLRSDASFSFYNWFSILASLHRQSSMYLHLTYDSLSA